MTVVSKNTAIFFENSKITTSLLSRNCNEHPNFVLTTQKFTTVSLPPYKTSIKKRLPQQITWL
jgi:hypothetical protein